MRLPLLALVAAIGLLSASTTHAQICTAPNCTAGASGEVSAATVKATGGSAERSLAAHFADRYDARDYGVTQVSGHDDTAGFLAEAAAAPNGAETFIPSGDMTLTGQGFPSAVSGVTHYWWMPGTTFNSGQPIAGINADPIFGTIGGSWWMTRGSTTPDSQTSLLRVDDNWSTAGGTAGNVSSAVRDSCNITNVSLNNYVWCNQTVLSTSAYGVGQHVAVAGTVFRQPWTDSNGARTETWALYGENNDLTGLSSDLSGPQVGEELDLVAGDRDNNARIVLQVGIGKNSGFINPRVGAGVNVGLQGSDGYYGNNYGASGYYDTAAYNASNAHPLTITIPTTAAQSNTGQTLTFTTTHGGVEYGQAVTGTGIASGTTVYTFTDTTVTLSTATTAAIPSGTAITFTTTADAFRMAAGQTIDFSNDTKHTLYWNLGGFFYCADGICPLEVEDGGNIDMPYVLNANVVKTNQIIEAGTGTPASSSAPCTTGQRSWDANYEYRCVATNSWRRIANSTF